MQGKTVGSYRISTKLAQGGAGEIYAARHELMDRDAVVKVLRPEKSVSARMVKRFFNEARAAASIRHPGIVEVFDMGYADDGRAYIVMERLDGEMLSSRLERGKLQSEQAIPITRQLASALGAAHERNIVHRDLKPDNIYLVPDPDIAGGERIKILDFGIAKLSTMPDTAMTQVGSVIGTPAYMSPEQFINSASVDHRTDIYALGCILYECLCGRPPFGQGGLALREAHVSEKPLPPSKLESSVWAELESIVLKLIAKSPDARFQTCEELMRALDRVAEGFDARAPTRAGSHNERNDATEPFTLRTISRADSHIDSRSDDATEPRVTSGKGRDDATAPFTRNQQAASLPPPTPAPPAPSAPLRPPARSSRPPPIPRPDNPIALAIEDHLSEIRTEVTPPPVLPTASAARATRPPASVSAPDAPVRGKRVSGKLRAQQPLSGELLATSVLRTQASAEPTESTKPAELVAHAPQLAHGTADEEDEEERTVLVGPDELAPLAKPKRRGAIVVVAIAGAAAAAAGLAFAIGSIGGPSSGIARPAGGDSDRGKVPTGRKGGQDGVRLVVPPKQPTASVAELAEVLDECEAAFGEERWEDALVAATQANEMDPGNARAGKCAQLARSERENATRYDEFTRAVADGNHVAAATAFSAIAVDSVYRERGRADNERMRDEYLDKISGRARRLAGDGKCEELDSLIGTARRAWSGLGDQLIRYRRRCERNLFGSSDGDGDGDDDGGGGDGGDGGDGDSGDPTPATDDDDDNRIDLGTSPRRPRDGSPDDNGGSGG